MDSIPLKRCPRCEQDLPLADFNKVRAKKDGHHSYCRACQKAVFAAHFIDNHAYHLERRKAHHATHQEQDRAYRKAHYAANREQVIAAVAEWAKNNPDKISANKKRQYVRHRDKKIANAATYAAANPDRVRGYKDKWQRANPLKRREIKHRRRAREYSTRVGRVDYQAIWDRDNGICHICLQPVNPTDLHYDHIIPLARGGTHTAENIAVSHKHCNLSKGARLL